MSLIYNTDKRTTIPRWRSHDLALRVGELSPLAINSAASPINFSRTSLSEQMFSWQRFKTVSHAADLFSSAYTLGLEAEFLEIAEFLFANKSLISHVLYRQISEVLEIAPQDAMLIDVNFDFFTEEGRKTTISEVSKLRNYLKKEPNNPLAWVELARNHSLLGNVDKSKYAINAALQVNDSSDRFVLRSAARFFHHLGEEDQAHSIIRKSKNLKSDPWLIASEIAFASNLDRRSGLVKYAKEIIKSGKFSPFQISELASAVGTAEFISDDLKNAKNSFKTALIDPNDNSLAQVYWFNDYFPFLNISQEQTKIPLAFEFQTHALYNNRKYEDACKAAKRWLSDEPYSTRPVRLASYISTIFLGDTNQSIEILKHGLKANPNDVKLLNSLSYNLLLENKIDEAEKQFKKYSFSKLNEEEISTKIAIVATTGLYNFRIGNIEEGRKNYQDSIEYAMKHKNDYLHSIAIANYVREEILVYKNDNLIGNKYIINSYLEKLSELTKKTKHADVLMLTEKVFSEYDKIK